MSNLNDHVCSLELARKLHVLGVKQSSQFYWRAWENPLTGHLKPDDVPESDWGLYWHKEKYSLSRDWEYSAFLASELMAMLSSPIDKVWIPSVYQHDGTYQTDYVDYCYVDTCLFASDTDSKNMSDSIAKLLVQIIENNLCGEEWRAKWLEV